MQTTPSRFSQGRNVSLFLDTAPCRELTYFLGHLPDIITDPVIETAKNRAHALRGTRELLLFVFV
jgi:hypothetical protein